MSPPRLAMWWLRRCLRPGSHGDSIRGDVIEEYERMPAGWRRKIWFWSATVQLTASYWGQRSPTPVQRSGERFQRPIWLRDVTHAFRLIRKRLAFSALAIATIAIGIGATTAIVSVVDRVLLRPLPFPDAHELVTVWNTYPRWRGHEVLGPLWDRVLISYPEYVDWRDDQSSFQSVAIYATTRMTLTGNGDPVEIGIGAASSSLFPLLGVQPHLGRFFREDEEGAAFTPHAVLSHSLWQTRFGESASVLGQRVTLNGQAYVVLGVLPPDFRLRSLNEESNVNFSKEAWIPAGAFGEADDRGQHSYEGIGRIVPGVSVEQAGAEAAALMGREGESWSQGAWAVSRQVEETGGIRGVLLLLLGAVSLLMMIAVVNVAALFLADAARRHREMALRAALGASRSRLISQLTVESGVIALAGTAVGVLLAAVGVRVLVGFAPADLPIPDQIGVDLRVLSFTIGLGFLAGLVFGVGPAVSITRGGRGHVLSQRTTFGPTAARGQRWLIGAEAALSLVLLIFAGLLGRSFLAMNAVDPGFERENLFVVKLAPNLEGDAMVRLAGDLVERASAIGGVTAVAVANAVPFSQEGGSSSFTIEGRAVEPGEKMPEAHRRSVDPRYLSTLGIPVLAGRGFRSDEGSQGVVLVSEAMAERYWDGESPIGSVLIRDRRRWEVIGIVGDVLHDDLRGTRQSTYYFPFSQQPSRRFSLIVRTGVPLATVADGVRGALQELAPNVAVNRIEPLREMVATSTAPARYRAMLVAAFGVCALVLAAVGVFGVTSRVVASRRRELGVRAALGATRSRVVHTVMIAETKAILGGVVVGLALAVVGSRWLGAFLFGVTTTDPVTFTVGASVLTAAGLLASYLPARQAGALEPVEVLRPE